MKKQFILILVVLIALALPGGLFALPPDGTGGWEDDGTTTSTDRNVEIEGTVTITGTVSTTGASTSISPVIAVATDTTLTAAQMNGSRVVLSGDGTALTIADSDNCVAGACILARIEDATAKSIDVSADDADNFELNGTAMSASYAIAIGTGNQGRTITICLDVAGSNEWIAKGDLEFTDSGGD